MKRSVLLFCLLPAIVLADERILDYHSDILVRQDGWIEVAETITVRAEGKAIRRGIYRDYPTRYKDRLGNDVEVEYEPKSVMRNGRSEDFNSVGQRNGLRTYFGSADRRLPEGEHTYVYRYDAGRMLGFFDAHDELYWNVTGLGWDFPIDRASANVRFGFPLPAESIRVEAYTGSYGAAGQDYRAATSASATASIETTKPLNPREGLTFVVSWPRGFVEQPGQMQRLAWALSDNLNLLVALAGFLVLLSYYILVWRLYGRDPAEGLIVARYEPPAGFSPASLRYIERMAYDDKAMTAAVVNLAVKGYLRIEKNGDKHLLQRSAAGANPEPLAPGEKALLKSLFRDGDRVELDNANHGLLGEARKKHEASLKRNYASRYFRTNGAMHLPALLLALSFSVLALNVGSGPAPLVFLFIAAMNSLIVVFAVLMKRPTGLGRKLLDQAAGFRDYLQIAEKDELNLRNPPEKTPELFERYLPFALAMGVEQLWAERFAQVFARLQGSGGASWQPSWYRGAWSPGNLGRTTSTVTKGLATAVSSSVRAPGSSSGSGGGGSSGGGGGGGGGGGSFGIF
ncbi:MAG: DUF2207 domain-containing protein, partial [Woeseia sp.]